MKRTNSTIIILSVALLILCGLCLKATPLITKKYDQNIVESLNNIYKTKLGLKLTEHYMTQLWFLGESDVKPYDDYKSFTKGKVYFILSRFIFAGLTALFVSLVSIVLFIINTTKKPQPAVSKTALIAILTLIILSGTAIRLLLASVCYGNYDMNSYEIVADIVTEGGDVYAETDRYNYSPVWFNVLAALKKIQLHFPPLPFHFVVRSFLCTVDLIALLLLLLIAREQKISLINTALFFYLNPVSFLITGHHGQFENLAILMLIAGLFAYLKLKQKPILGTVLLWLFATAGMIVKHNIFYELIICLNSAIKRYRIKLLLFTVSVCVFLSLFLPFWAKNSQKIIHNVFAYPSEPQNYGLVLLIDLPQLKYLFIAAMFIFPLLMKNKDIIRNCLMGMLFFLAFTTGIAPQYLMLPIALGALRPSKGFLFYSIATSLFLLGCKFNLYVPVLHLLKWNIVWVCAVYWFIEYWLTQRPCHTE